MAGTVNVTFHCSAPGGNIMSSALVFHPSTALTALTRFALAWVPPVMLRKRTVKLLPLKDTFADTLIISEVLSPVDTAEGMLAKSTKMRKGADSKPGKFPVDEGLVPIP